MTAELYFSRVDNRRHKEYALVAEQRVFLPRGVPAAPLRVALANSAAKPRIEMEHWSTPTNDTTAYRLTWRFPADKPSAIMPEEDAREIIEPLQPIIDEGLSACIRAHRVAEERATVTKQAQHLARWYGKTAVERAKTAVRYEQRLAALHAEMDAELAIQLKAIASDKSLDEHVKASTFQEQPYDPRAHEAAKRLAERFAAYNPHPFASAVELTEQDVFPEEEEEKGAA